MRLAPLLLVLAGLFTACGRDDRADSDDVEQDAAGAQTEAGDMAQDAPVPLEPAPPASPTEDAP